MKKNKLFLQQYVIINLKLNIFKNMNQVISIYFLSFLLNLKLNINFYFEKQITLSDNREIINTNNLNYKIPKNKKIENFFNKLNNIFIYSNIGKSSNLEIIGYIRRAWYKKKKRLIILRLGHSYYNSNIVPNKILFGLLKKRLLFFFSNNISFLNQFSHHICNFKPTDSYKLSGIVHTNQKILLKKSKKQQAGSSY